MRNKLNQLRKRGQGLVEYALILVLIAIVVIVILGFLGNQVNATFSKIDFGKGFGLWNTIPTRRRSCVTSRATILCPSSRISPCSRAGRERSAPRVGTTRTTLSPSIWSKNLSIRQVGLRIQERALRHHSHVRLIIVSPLVR